MLVNKCKIHLDSRITHCSTQLLQLHLMKIALSHELNDMRIRTIRRQIQGTLTNIVIALPFFFLLSSWMTIKTDVGGKVI